MRSCGMNWKDLGACKFNRVALRTLPGQKWVGIRQLWTRDIGQTDKGQNDGTGRVGCHTPRSSRPTGMGKLDRFTPNGTKVPHGTPPDDVQHVPRPPQELPAVPPMPSSFMNMEENDMKRFWMSMSRLRRSPKF